MDQQHLHSRKGNDMRKAKHRLAAAIAVTLSTISLTVITAPAWAAGTSNATNGCYAKWWNTAFSGDCNRSTQSGQYRLVAACNNQRNFYGKWKYIGKDS